MTVKLSLTMSPCCYSKCLFELAVLSLSDQGLISRHGFGGCNTALYSIPEGSRRTAESVAYQDFPDDNRFVYTASRVAARVPCNLNRRIGSPRQLAARTRGVFPLLTDETCCCRDSFAMLSATSLLLIP